MNKVKILIVEDDIFSASIIKKILSNHSYEVTDIISDSGDVMSSIDKNVPDLILMDIVIQGGMDGIQIAEIIKEKNDIPIIYLTGDSSEETIQRAKITEPFGYLIKPVNEKILLTNIELSIFKQNEQIKRNLKVLKEINDELEIKVRERTKELYDKNEQLSNEIKQRLEAEEKLKKSERLTTIVKMSAVLAHEIRNPLNSIKINTDILSSLDNISDSNKRRLQIIKKEVNRLDGLVKEVLQYSRINSLLKTEFNLHQFFDNLRTQFLQGYLAKKIDFINESESISIYADNEKLSQVFWNLIINAYDALPENGIITIYTERGQNEISILVKDNGFGIPDKEKIFEPFYTTKSMGTGLGLSISENIIELHNGSLTLLKSKPGETIFCVKLPLTNKRNRHE